jgi:hypothetical protein
MKVQEFTELLEKQPLNQKAIEEIKKAYGVDVLPQKIKELISLEKPFFLEGGKRILSKNEILHADINYETAFSKEGILPLVQDLDNELIVFHTDTGTYSKYSCSDEVSFLFSKDLETLLGM